MTEAEIAGQATQPEPTLSEPAPAPEPAPEPTVPRRRGRPPKDRTVAVKKDEAPADDKAHVHHVHFLEDGVTALDRVFLRGEEAVIKPNTPWWDLAHDRDGNCVFAMDRHDQIMRFGRHLWDEGTWPFSPYDLQARLDNGDALTTEEQAILDKANKERFSHQPVGASRANRK